MQRTIKGTKYTYIESRLEYGKPVAEIREVSVPYANAKVAKRAANKIVGYDFNPVKVEEFEKLYYMDDNFFIENAIEVVK